MLTNESHGWVILSVLLVLGSTATATEASTIAADNLTATYALSRFDYGIGFAGAGLGGPFSNEAPAQEFTARVSGTVTTLIASIQQVRSQGVPLNVSIFTVASHLPGTQLGSVSFAQAQVSSNVHSNLSALDLSAANISLTAGQSYFAIFSVATPINRDARYEAILLDSNAHFFGFPPIVSPDGGKIWLSPVIADEIGMTVFVRQTTIPEASSTGLVAMSIGTLFFLRRRKKCLGRNC